MQLQSNTVREQSVRHHSTKLFNETSADRTRSLVLNAELRKENDQLKTRMETYFRSIKLPMEVAESDISDFKLSSEAFSESIVKETVIEAFATSRQVKDDAIRKIQTALAKHVGGQKKVCVAIYETARQNLTSISFYSKHWVTFKFNGIRVLAWTS